MALAMTPFGGGSYPAGTYLLVVEGFWDGTTIPGTEYEFEVGAAEGCSSDEPFHQPLTFEAPPVSGVLCRFDVDRYLLTQPATGSFEVKLDFDPAEGNLELVLTDLGGTVIGRSQGTGPSESIQVEDAPAGSYVAHVVGHHGAGNSYSIEWR